MIAQRAAGATRLVAAAEELVVEVVVVAHKGVDNVDVGVVADDDVGVENRPRRYSSPTLLYSYPYHPRSYPPHHHHRSTLKYNPRFYCACSCLTYLPNQSNPDHDHSVALAGRNCQHHQHHRQQMKRKKAQREHWKDIVGEVQ